MMDLHSVSRDESRLSPQRENPGSRPPSEGEEYLVTLSTTMPT